MKPLSPEKSQFFDLLNKAIGKVVPKSEETKEPDGSGRERRWLDSSQLSGWLPNAVRATAGAAAAAAGWGAF